MQQQQECRKFYTAYIEIRNNWVLFALSKTGSSGKPLSHQPVGVAMPLAWYSMTHSHTGMPTLAIREFFGFLLCSWRTTTVESRIRRLPPLRMLSCMPSFRILIYSVTNRATYFTLSAEYNQCWLTMLCLFRNASLCSAAETEIGFARLYHHSPTHCLFLSASSLWIWPLFNISFTVHQFFNSAFFKPIKLRYFNQI